MKILTTSLTDKRDMINAGNAVGVMKDYEGKDLHMMGYVVYEDEKDGATQVVTAVKTELGFIGSTSANIRSTVEMIASAYEADEIAQGVAFTIRSAESKNGRKFLTMELI